jgi:hypothetical protein
MPRATEQRQEVERAWTDSSEGRGEAQKRAVVVLEAVGRWLRADAAVD